MILTALAEGFMKRIDAAIAVVINEGKVLICQRKKDDSFGGFWEFPGGKCEPGETLESCLIRELQEEVALLVQPVEAYPPIAHDYPTVKLTLHPFRCKLISGQLQLIECQQAQWVAPQSLRNFRFPPANAALIERIQKQFTPASADAPCNS
jgi:mutator protein MutT